MNSKIEIKIKQEICVGCGACFNVCPQQAISIVQNNKGFYVPKINKQKCSNCGLCERVCPLDNYNSSNINKPEVLVFQNSDKKVLYKCASGGAFAFIAEQVIEQGGIVYGAIYDDDVNVIHTRADNLKELEAMYSSKYVQSNIMNCYKLAKKDLNNGKFVLFSGTPCQIAGLKSYLRQEYNNLLTVDIICHGVPSPAVFEQYKKELVTKNFLNKHLSGIDFRSKINGWSPYSLAITTSVYLKSNDDDYMKLFLTDLSINDSCLDCKFNKLPRVADLSLGDFWGVDQFNKSLNDNKGLSIITINNRIGQHFIDKIRNEMFLAEVPIEYIIKYNPNICKSSIGNKNRNKFFNDIKNGKTLKYCAKKYLKTSLYAVLYRLLPTFIQNFIKYKILRKKDVQ